MGKVKQVVEIDMAAVEGLLERIRSLLSHDDYKLLQGLVNSFMLLTRLVRKRGTTIARLRRLVGLSTSEKTADVLDKDATQGGTTEPAGRGDVASDSNKECSGLRRRTNNI